MKLQLLVQAGLALLVVIIVKLEHQEIAVLHMVVYFSVSYDTLSGDFFIVANFMHLLQPMLQAHTCHQLLVASL